jgi:hypothetical protein
MEIALKSIDLLHRFMETLFTAPADCKRIAT